MVTYIIWKFYTWNKEVFLFGGLRKVKDLKEDIDEPNEWFAPKDKPSFGFSSFNLRNLFLFYGLASCSYL